MLFSDHWVCKYPTPPPPTHTHSCLTISSILYSRKLRVIFPGYSIALESFFRIQRPHRRYLILVRPCGSIRLPSPASAEQNLKCSVMEMSTFAPHHFYFSNSRGTHRGNVRISMIYASKKISSKNLKVLSKYVTIVNLSLL